MYGVLETLTDFPSRSVHLRINHAIRRFRTCSRKPIGARRHAHRTRANGQDFNTENTERHRGNRHRESQGRENSATTERFSLCRSVVLCVLCVKFFPFLPLTSGMRIDSSSPVLRQGRSVILSRNAEVAELADAPALGAGGRKAVGVRVPSSALPFRQNALNRWISSFYRGFRTILGRRNRPAMTGNEPIVWSLAVYCARWLQ